MTCYDERGYLTDSALVSSGSEYRYASRLLGDLPLTLEEYELYKKEREFDEQSSKTWEKHTAPLAVLHCNGDFIDDLFRQGSFVMLQSTREVVPALDCFLGLTNEQLTNLEAKLRDAVSLSRTEALLDIFHWGWPDGWNKATRKAYFRSVHDVARKELERRGISPDTRKRSPKHKAECITVMGRRFTARDRREP
jgi:hypothetical protein